MKLKTSKVGKVGDSEETLSLSWRDVRYHRFYKIVDQLVNELEKHIWISTAKPKRILKGNGLKKLQYSVECLVRDCVAVVLQSKIVLKVLLELKYFTPTIKVRNE